MIRIGSEQAQCSELLAVPSQKGQSASNREDV